MKSIWGKYSFSLGEISPRCFGRSDQEKPIYRDGAAYLENFLVSQQGAAFYRPGSTYIATAGQVAPVRLSSFQYSLLQEYILELGNQYMQFYANGGQVMSGGNPVNITTPYLQADLFNLQFAGQEDVSYIADANYPVYKLIRTSATSFLIQQVQFIGGPFMDSNVGNVTLTASATTGSITLTATIPSWGSGNQYIPGDYVTNGGTTYLCQLTHVSGTFATDLANGNWVAQNFFVAGHLGSLWSVGAGTTGPPAEPPGTFVCTTVTSATVLTGYVQSNPDGTAGAISTTSATTQWAEGCFSTFRGFPVSCTFHEGRLILAGTTTQPKTAWASVVGSYEDFSTGQATDSDSWQYTASVGGAIQWMKSVMVNGAIGLRMGTMLGTTVWLDGSNSGITPSSPPNIIPGPDYQVQYTAPATISSFLYYLQGNTYQLRQLIYNYINGADKSEDMTLLADHILRSGGGSVKMSRQQSPCDRIWVPRNDGQLAILTRNEEQQVMAWTRFIAGNTSGGAGIYNDCTIISVQGGDDQVWVAVSRIVNGTPVQFIEMFSNELFNNYWEPNRLDASLHLDNPITITGISLASPAVITAPAHGLTNGQQVKFDIIVGLTETVTNALGQVVVQGLNMNQYLVANATTNTFTITDLAGNAISTVGWSPYISGGQVRLMNTTFSGLSYLNGEYVTVVADGGLVAGQQTFLVSGGSITLPFPAAVVTAGLQYTGTLQLLPLSEYVEGMPTQGMKRKVYNPVVKFWNSAGGQFGDSLTNLYNIIYDNQNASVIPAQLPGLYTGDQELDMESFFDKNWGPFIVQNVPLPMMILSLIFRSDIEADK